MSPSPLLAFRVIVDLDLDMPQIGSGIWEFPKRGDPNIVP